jgi:hypothetical protein
MAIQEVHQDDSGPKVATLHKGLLYLIRNQGGMIKPMRKALESELEPERVTNSFGWATTSIVGHFQYQIRNRGNLSKPVKERFANIPLSRKDDGTGNGDVDKLTAQALNWLIRETAVYGPPPPFKPPKSIADLPLH